MRVTDILEYKRDGYTAIAVIVNKYKSPVDGVTSFSVLFDNGSPYSFKAKTPDGDRFQVIAKNDEAYKKATQILNKIRKLRKQKKEIIDDILEGAKCQKQ